MKNKVRFSSDLWNNRPFCVRQFYVIKAVILRRRNVFRRFSNQKTGGNQMAIDKSRGAAAGKTMDKKAALEGFLSS